MLEHQVAQAVRRVAVEIRRFCVSLPAVEQESMGGRFPRKWCRAACSLLTLRLRDHIELSSTRLANGQRRDAAGEPENHYWLVVDALIVDITGDQFPDFPHDGVFVSSDDRWHSQFRENHRRESVAPLVPQILAQPQFADLYQRLVAK
jgi:hypothetical protein